MPSASVTVSVSEVLEVRAGPLTDHEIWALLYRALHTLTEAFSSGSCYTEQGQAFVINPDAIHLTSVGAVQFGSAQKVQQYANYVAPECVEPEFETSQTSVELVYMFALGKSLIYSSEYGLRTDERNALGTVSKPVRIAESLEAVLRGMVNRDPSQRSTLRQVADACAIQNERMQRGLRRSFSRTVTDLYNTILGPHVEQEGVVIGLPRPRERPHKRSRDRLRRKSSPDQHRSRSRSLSRSRQTVQGRDSDSSSSNGNPVPSQNGQSLKKAGSSSSKVSSCPSSRTVTSQRSFETAAFRKYLKLKERQKKLRVLRHDMMSDEASDELSDFVVDHISETQSVRSMGSSNAGVYHPQVHSHHGSSSALRMSRDSDRESVVSSDTSVYMQDHVPFRATAVDISDPFIDQLQRLSSAPPTAVNHPTHHTQTPPTPTNHLQAPPPKQQKAKKKSPPAKQQPPREFFGPEFIHGSTKPLQKIPLSIQGETHKGPSRVCRVVIVLLNGRKLEAMVDPSLTGQQLYEAVVTEIDLPEFYFFGLTYINDSEHFFISPDTKLHKVAPEGWRDSWKREAAPITFTVHLRVKFYVENISALKLEMSCHQLYLQLRRDLLEERCMCPDERAMTLTGLALQAEYGDYLGETLGRNYFIPEHYFPERVVKRLGAGYIRDHAPNVHRLNSGMTQTEAEIEFIQFVQQELPEYGVHFHKLLKKKGDSHNVIWVGVNMNNLLLAENSAHQVNHRVLVHQYPWGAIQKISFNRRRFSVQPRPDIGQIKPFKMNFYTTSYKKGQYLLKFCTSQHSFLLKLRTRLAAQDWGTDPSFTEHMSTGDADDLHIDQSDEDEQTVTDGTSRASQNSQEVEMLSAGFQATDHVPQKHPAAYRNPPPYRPDSSASMIDLPRSTLHPPGHLHALPHSQNDENVARILVVKSGSGIHSQVSSSNPVTSHAAERTHRASAETSNVDTESASSEHGMSDIKVVKSAQAYVIDASIYSTDQTLFSGPGNETISPSLHQRFHDELLSPESTQPERSMFQVELSKHPQLGVGITIVGGSNKNGYGIFVKSVTLDGPAFKDGRIKPGDQILEINGSNLSEVQHHDAVKLIKESENTVKFLISQVKPPRSLKHRDNDDAVFQWKLQNSMVSKSIDMEDRESDSSRNSPSNLPVCDELTDSDVNIATVNNSDIDDKKSTKVKNPEKKSPDMDIGDANSPKSVINGADSCNGNSVVAKIHSMLSDDGLQKSEPVASDHVTAPEGDQYCSENESDTETDSDFEEVCTAVIQNRYAAPPLGNTSPTLGKNGEDISPTQGQEEELEVFLEKQNGSFGLNVTGGVNTSVRHGGIYVKSVVANSAAHKDGTILKGDRILEVDSVAMSGLTHREAVQALQDAPPICRLLVSRLRLLKGTSKEQAMEGQIGDTTSLERCEDDLYGTFVNEENSYSVDLIKGIYGLGFSTVGGQPDSPALSDRVVRIKRVFPIGPARESGKIRSGDVILAVNGQSVTGKSLTEIMSMLRGAGKSVQLLMCHPDPDQLPPLNVLESEESLVVTPSSNRSVVSDTDSDSEASDDQFQPSYTEEMLSLALYGNHGTVAETGEQNELSAANDNCTTGINLDGDNGEEDQDNDEEHSDNTETPRSDGVTPPLPTSPPPTLGRTTEGLAMDGYKQGAEFSDEQGMEFTDEQGAELSDEQEESDYEEGNDSPNLHLIDVQVGVAELMDSCHAEMVQIHSAKSLSKLAGMTQIPVSENLIVREDSTLTVNSRETTPVANASFNSAEFMPDSSSELSYAKESELEDSEIDASLVHHDQTDAEDITRRSHEDGIIVQSLEDTVLQEMVHQATGSLGSNPTSVSVSSANMVASCSNVDGVKFTGIVDNNVIDISGKYSVNDVCTDAEEQAVNEAADVNIKKILIDKKTSEFDNNEDSESDFDDDDIKQLEKKYMDLEQAEDSENESESEGSKNEDQENEDNDEGTDETENVEKGTDNDLGTGISYATLMDSNPEEDIVESLRNKNDPESFDFTGLNSDMIQYGIERKPGKSNNEVYSDIDDTYKVNDGESDFDETEEQKDDSEHADNLNDLTDLISEVRRQTGHENDVDDEVENVDEDRNDVMKNEDGSRVRKESSSQSEVKPLLPGEFEVTLAKPEGCGLGFTVAGGANTSGGCYVKAVLANPALSDGRIKAGDKIIMVAGIDMRPLNHFEAVSVLRETEADVTIRLFRPDVAMGDPGQAGVRINSHELTHKHNNRQKTTSEHPECEGDTSHVSSSPENTKKQHKWTFLTDPHTSEDESEAQPESAGLLRDLIHSLEATKSELTSPGAGRRSPSLRSPRQVENVLQDRSRVRGGTSPGNRSPGLGEGSVYQIELRKAEGGGGLGISLVNAESTHMTGVFIHTIIPGGLAHRDGRLKEGDKLLQINGESLVGMNHTKAASILRNCEGKLSLTVSRKDRKPSWLEADLESSQAPTENWADTTDPDSCTEFEVSEVNDSSVSISRHVQSDIHDDGVDDLVAGAEQVLTMSKKSKHLSRSDENVSDDDDYDDNDGNNFDDDAPPPLPEKRLSNSSHKFLAGTNVISPKPDEISVESGSDSLDEDVENDDDEEFEKLNEDAMNDDDEDFEKLILGDRSSESGDDDEEDEYNATYAMKRFDSSKCWCNNLRTLVMEVPEEITEEWLYTLSLVTVPVGYRAQIPGLVSALQERITLEDPQEEYRQLRDVPLTDMCEAATLIHNRPKNRFRNVLPYDINRVLLESQDSSWDYINASHIQLEVGESVADYIVTQGPLPETTDDFWVMTWQQGVTVVVMLTLEMEGSKVKCHRYWPDSADTSMEVCDGALRLSLLYHNSLADFDVRTLLMEDTSNGDTRIVHHLHYTTWPDHGTPTVARPLLQCMRLSHLLRSEGPIVVHCSAGIGRSGTFIAIDLALAHVENSMQFDIMELVTELRRQRQGMIQTRDQYVFCYTACVEALLETPM